MKLITEQNSRQNIRNVRVGEGVKLYDFVNLYECEIGDETQVGTFVEIQKGAQIGKRCRIQSHAFICDGVTVEDEVYVGHGVIFMNDKYPSVVKTLNKSWKKLPILVKKGAVIGSGALIMGGVTIGENSFVGAGAVVTKDVPDDVTVAGVPAREMSK